jgi:hypothetical protein
VTEAVVQLAALGVGEHLVRLDDLAEAVLRVRRFGDVGMQFPGESAKGALDVVCAGIAGDAEELVVVALRAQLSS